MENFVGPGLAVVGCSVKKRRSSSSRRPRPISQISMHGYDFVSLPTQAAGTGSYEGQNCKSVSNGLGSENKLKLKLKLGGVTRTIHTKSTSEHALNGLPAVAKSSYSSDTPLIREKSFLQGKGYEVQWKDVSKNGSYCAKGSFSSSGKTSGTACVNDINKYGPTRKSKRIPKRRVLDVGFNSDDDEEDEEIRYLGRYTVSNDHTNYDDEEDERNERYCGTYEDKDYLEEETISEDELGCKWTKMGKGLGDLSVEGRNESTPTTRNWALHSGKNISASGSSHIEFPDGLPHIPPKKQKEKLSGAEQQLKKAEAAQRRRMQSEKAAREAEAEAIRKILGQDAGRKKREEKMKKQRYELGKAAKSETLASNTIRWVSGPTGTAIIFSEDIGLPTIFKSVPSSYPPPREKCAGPNCTNAYRYRDSKSKLPLCSLLCYKAMHEKAQPLIAC